MQKKHFILVVTKYFTKWPIALATEAADASIFANFVYNQIFTIFGLPKAILTNCRLHFNNNLFKAICEQVKTHHHLTTAYNSQCNGLTKRFNQNLVQVIEKSCTDNPCKWPNTIPSVLWAHHTKIHTRSHHTSYKLIYGFKYSSNPLAAKIDVTDKI